MSWTPSQVNHLKKLVKSKEHSYMDMARIMAKSVWSVESKIKQLNLPYTYKYYQCKAEGVHADRMPLPPIAELRHMDGREVRYI